MKEAPLITKFSYLLSLLVVVGACDIPDNEDESRTSGQDARVQTPGSVQTGDDATLLAENSNDAPNSVESACEWSIGFDEDRQLAVATRAAISIYFDPEILKEASDMFAALLGFTLTTSTAIPSAAAAAPGPELVARTGDRAGVDARPCAGAVGFADVDEQYAVVSAGRWWYVRYPSYWDPSMYVDYPGSPFSSYDSANHAFYLCNQEHNNACVMWGPV